VSKIAAIDLFVVPTISFKLLDGLLIPFTAEAMRVTGERPRALYFADSGGASAETGLVGG
jgi:hypothetical protein